MVVTLLLILHVAFGFISLAVGTLIAFRRKADATHARLGTVFFWSMLTMAACGLALALIHPNVLLVVIAVGSSILVLLGRASMRSTKGTRDSRWRRHIGFMGGGLISAWTAFIVVNQPPFIPPLVVWIGPSVIGTVIIIRASRKYVPMRSLVVLFMLSLGPSLLAQDAAAPAEGPQTDLSWLAAIQKPVIVTDWIGIRYDSASRSVVVDNLVIVWNDSTDKQMEDHSIKKVFNCVPVGDLVDGRGDTVKVQYQNTHIDVVQRDDSQWVYRMTSPLVLGPGRFPHGKVTGTLMLMINAAKLVDRRYSVEGSASVNVSLE